MKCISLEKFSDVSVSVRSMLALKEETITAMNLLLYMLRQKTEKYPDKQKITSELSNNYAMNVSAYLRSYGNQLSFDMRFQYIRSDWIEKEGYDQKVCELMDQFIHHVLFDEEGLEEAKFLLSNRLKRQKDDPSTYSVWKAFSIIDKDCSLRIPMQGDLEQIENIKLDQIQSLWKEIQEAPKSIYVCGHPSNFILDYLKSFKEASLHTDYEIFHTDQMYSYEESMDISQSNLTLLYQSGTSIESEDYFPLYVLNSLLGQSPNSLLFSEIREKHSFCYSIYSHFIRFEGVIAINTGLKKEYIDLALDLIDQQIKRLQEGDFNFEQLDIAKKDIKDAIVSAQDSGFSMISQNYLDDLLHRPLTIEKRLEAIDAVSVEQIQKVAKQLSCFVKVVIKENEHESI